MQPGLLHNVIKLDTSSSFFPARKQASAFDSGLPQHAVRSGEAMQTARNPDTRPLPEGWIQHYESSKQLWYYVQTTSMPPKVLFTHPLDLERSSRKSSHITSPQVERPVSIIGQPNPLPPIPQGLTLAQKLYASSGSNISTPMISNSDIQNLSTAPEPHPPSRASMLPTPPPSNSPPGGRRSSFVPPPPPPPIPPGQSLLASNRPTDYGHSMASLGTAGSRMSTHPVNSSIGYASTSSAGPSSISSHVSSVGFPSDAHGPHRTQSLQVPFPPPHLPGRTNTYSAGQSLYASSKPHNLAPRPTPHLTTTARPPANLQGATHNQLTPPHSSSLSSSPSSNQSLSPLCLPNHSPPSSSVLFSQSTSAPLSARPGSSAFATPPISPPPPPLSPTLSSPISNNSTITPENFHKYSKMGQLGSQAYRIAGSVLTANMGLPLGMLPDPVKLIDSLKAAFSKNSNVVAESDLQAVANAMPDANYQAIINALVRQQQQYQQQLASQLQMQTAMGMQYQRPPQPAVDYHALIAEVQNLQVAAQTQQASALLTQQQASAQQQTLSQLHMSAQQQHQFQHQQAMEALKVQQAAILQQQTAAAQHAQQQAAMRMQAIQQQQAAAAAQLQLQLQQQQEQQQTYAQNLQAQLQHQQQQAIAQQQAMLNAGMGAHQPSRPPLGQQQQQNPNPLQNVLSSIYGSINQQQQQQNPPTQNVLSSIYETINSVQQQQQPQNPPAGQSDVTTFFEMYNSAQQQINQQQQQSMVDMMNAMSLGGTGTQPPPPAFDPSSMFAGDPVGAASANVGTGIFDTIAQTINGATSTVADPTGGVAGAISGFSQAFSGTTTGVDPSTFTGGLDFGSLGDTIGNAFSS